MPDGAVTSDISKRVLHVLKWLGVVGGAAVGLGGLAFGTGFLAERAQYEYAQVPFVFVDYYAYAETGALGLLDTVYVVAARWWLVVLILISSVGIVLLLENAAFKRFSHASHWLFLGFLLCLASEAVLVRQQLNVRSTPYRVEDTPSARSSESDTAPRSPSTVAAAVTGSRLHAASAQSRIAASGQAEDAVPVVWPYSWLVARPAQWHVDDTFIPTTSFEAWERIADELERAGRDKRLYFELRPRPEWIANGEKSFLGVPVPTAQAEQARARYLYEAMVAHAAALVWMFTVFIFWDRGVLAGLSSSSRPAKSATSLLGRLAEELWFACHWILRPTAAVGLIGALALLAECYGILAMPRVGHELVDVVVTQPTTTASDARPASPATALSRITQAVERKAIAELRDGGADLLREYPLTEPEQRDELTKRWASAVEGLEAFKDRSAADALMELRDMASVVAPALSRHAADAWSRAAADLGMPRSGYILAYPRSDTAYLRLIVRKPWAEASGWTTYPIPMASISEIRVRQDERVGAIVALLRRMRELNPPERGRALIEIERLGFPRMLEIWMGAALDSSPVLKGDALTNVGRFAAELPATSSGAFRRRRAAAVLLRVVEDTSIRVDMRGAAATALHYVLGRSSRELCPRLQGLLNVAPDQDPHWELRGTVITALGQMECRESRATLEQILLEWKDVPRHVATTVPSVLARLGAPEAIPALLAVIKRPDTPEAVFGTAISAVGRLGANSTATTQSRQRTDIAQALVAAGRRTKGDVLIAILGALRNLGDRGVLPFVVELSTRLLESDKDVRGMALTVVIQLGEPTVEAHLSHIAFDSEEQLLNRMLAVMGLGGIHTDTAVDQLEKLHRGAPAPLQRATIEALRSLYQSGSGRAGAAINRLEQEGATSDNDQEPAPLSSLESLATEPTPP